MSHQTVIDLTLAGIIGLLAIVVVRVLEHRADRKKPQ